MLIGIAVVLVLNALGMDKVLRAVGAGFSAVYAIRANISYYKKVVEDEAPWL